jgi:ABC-type phosphate transport system substrate-binding protein
MMKSRIETLLQTAFSRSWLALGLLLCSPALAQEVIVNANVADRSVSQSSVRAIFSMRMRQWQDGTPVKVFVLPDQNPVHVSFAKGRLNTFPHQLRRSWDLLVYSGSGQAPTVVESPTEMLQKVSSTAGAIGYLPEDYLKKGDKNEQFRILQIR